MSRQKVKPRTGRPVQQDQAGNLVMESLCCLWQSINFPETQFFTCKYGNNRNSDGLLTYKICPAENKMYLILSLFLKKLTNLKGGNLQVRFQFNP